MAKPSKKYTDKEPESDEHFYQNQLKFDNNVYFNARPSLQQQNLNLKNKNNFQSQQSKTNLIQASSSSFVQVSSSERSFIMSSKKLSLSYCFLVSAILFLTLSFIIISITFIFPFWITLSIENRSSNQTTSTILNITNFENNLSLLGRNGNETFNNKRIVFDLGIWEVKMHQELEFNDLVTRLTYKNAYPQSMLWLNSDLNNQVESFLIKFLQFVDLKSANLFTVQILEIMHLIFTFLTLCFTSFTLCLCTNHRSSLCWYLVCFFMCLISFLTGLAVIVLLVVWHTVSIPNLRDPFSAQQNVVKSFNWCFWCAVGINFSILIAAFFILIYLSIVSVMLCKQKKDASTNQSRLIEEIKSTNPRLNPKANRSYSNSYGVDNIALDYPSQTRLPRIQTSFAPQNGTNGSRASTALAMASQERVLSKSSSHSLVQGNKQDNINNNPSYIFYTGHGNYRKQSLSLEEISPEYEPANDSIRPSHLLNFSLVSQHQVVSQNQSLTDHPYSNVADQAQNEFRFMSYK